MNYFYDVRPIVVNRNKTQYLLKITDKMRNAVSDLDELGYVIEYTRTNLLEYQIPEKQLICQAILASNSLSCTNSQTLDIENAIIKLDAMGCQEEIAKQIIHQKGNYILALKGNHSGLLEELLAWHHKYEREGLSEEILQRIRRLMGMMAVLKQGNVSKF